MEIAKKPVFLSPVVVHTWDILCEQTKYLQKETSTFAYGVCVKRSALQTSTRGKIHVYRGRCWKVHPLGCWFGEQWSFHWNAKFFRAFLVINWKLNGLVHLVTGSPFARAWVGHSWIFSHEPTWFVAVHVFPSIHMRFFNLIVEQMIFV